jgi:hypothetical protein
MPCDSSYMDPNHFESEISKVACLLDELQGKKWEKKDWEGYHPSVYCKINKEKADKMVDKLCSALKNVDVTEYSLEMQIWWRDHKKVDDEKDRKPLALYFELDEGRRTQTALFDGYPVGSRILEQVMFITTIVNGRLEVKIHPDDAEYFKTLNESYWLKKVTDYVQDYDVFSDPDTGEDAYLVTDRGENV